MVTGDFDASGRDDVIADFGEVLGLWARLNNTSTFKLLGRSPEGMAVGDLDGSGRDDLILDLGALGIWVGLAGTSISQLHGLSPESMVTGDLDGSGQDDVIIDFGADPGVWIRFNNTSWSLLDPL